jgi:hypothetical protein
MGLPSKLAAAPLYFSPASVERQKTEFVCDLRSIRESNCQLKNMSVRCHRATDLYSPFLRSLPSIAQNENTQSQLKCDREGIARCRPGAVKNINIKYKQVSPPAVYFPLPAFLYSFDFCGPKTTRTSWPGKRKREKRYV